MRQRLTNSEVKVLAAVLLVSWISMVTGSTVDGQTRDQKVRADRDKLITDMTWYYDDLDKGLAAARKRNQPLMVVLRCIP